MPDAEFLRPFPVQIYPGFVLQTKWNGGGYRKVSFSCLSVYDEEVLSTYL